MARIPCNTGGITTLWSLSRSQKKVVMKCTSDFCSQSSGSFCNTSARICIPFSLNSGFLSVRRGPNFSTNFKRSALWPWIPEAKMTQVFYIHLLTPWNRVLLEKLTGSQVVKKFPAFKEPEGSSPCSQLPATCTYPEPDRSSQCPHISLPDDPYHHSIARPQVADGGAAPSIESRSEYIV